MSVSAARGFVVSNPSPGERRPEALLAYAERRIKAAIADGSIPPGSRLSPTALAADYGISHIPVREALTYLNAAGYVDHRHRLGFSARNLSSEDLADIYHWRQVLENEAYRMAVPKMTTSDIATMRRLAKTMATKTKPRDRVEYLELNRTFHFVAFTRTDSERLIRFLSYLWDVAAPYATAESYDSTPGNADHYAAIDLIVDGDVDGLIALMDQHRHRRVEHIGRWEASHLRDGAE